MRDLASRLRAIVHADGAVSRRSDEPSRELTYVPDVAETGVDLDGVAATLGGRRYERSGSTCLLVDRTWPSWHSHGRRSMASCAIDPDAAIGLIDPRVAVISDWARHIVFFDIETTGLSGGAGTIAFLAGCGWFDDEGGFIVRQFLVAGPAGERALLEGLEEIFAGASLVVTYNGRTFDLPVMDMRWAFHRRESPVGEVPHLDMLPPARRLWGRGMERRDLDVVADGSSGSSCSLSSLERSVLGFHRLGDVPGFEIPTRYFQFLRTGDARCIDGVLDHNRHDIVSLAALTSHVLRLVADGPGACATAGEQCGLGMFYERAGDATLAMRAYELAAAGGERDARRRALGRLAVLMRRDDRFEEAAAAWQGVLDLATRGRTLGPLERRAAEALAIHHEHRLRDLETAGRYASTLERDGMARRHDLAVKAAARRLARIDRKRASRQNAKGGPEAALLLDE